MLSFFNLFSLKAQKRSIFFDKNFLFFRLFFLNLVVYKNFINLFLKL